MKRVLLVDDDAFVLRMYQEALSQHDLTVQTAADGLAAIQALRLAKPDLVVLDLMMPKLTGVDVLKFMRGQKEFKTLPVVVLSNSYMNELSAQAAAVGVQKALLKTGCSPAVLLQVIEDILAGRATSEDPNQLLAAAKQTPPAKPAAPVPPPAAAPEPGPESSAAERLANAREAFFRQGPAACASLRKLFQLCAAAGEKERALRLDDLYRKVHFVAAGAALAQCRALAQMSSAFEALLFELCAKGTAFSPSVVRTMAAAVDLLVQLFGGVRDGEFDVPARLHALVVDDDAINNRLVVAALQRAHLEARSTANPVAALQWLQQHRYDLVLLDVEMPGMDGFEVCRRLRQLPGYQVTPVIYVTSHSDFAARSKGALSGGDDFIAKPVFGMELAVKAVTVLLKRQLELRRAKAGKTS